MKHEEAIKILRETHDNALFSVRTALETICPELAESEDERIRKEIISALKFANDGGIYDKHIAYLEKQKENPKTADSIPSNCTSCAKCEDRWHKVTDSLPDNGRLVLAKDCLGNVLLARYDGENWEVNVYDNEDHYCHNSISKWCEIPSEKQKEQKPISFYGHYNPDDYEVVVDGNATSLKKKKQKPIKMEVYEVGKGTTICGQDYKCKKDYKEGNCWYIKDVVYHCSRDGYLTDQNGISWSCTPEWFKEYIQSNTEWAEEEKTHFVSGQFLQCKLSFDGFKEGEHYWLEYVGNDIYVGRSDNILNQKFHITPRQLFTLFSQELEEVQGPPQEEKQVSLNYEPLFDENPSDKEIVEALIKHLKEQDGFLTAIDSVSTKAILSWLEKQKEQKPAEWSEEDVKRLYSIGTEIGFLKGRYSEWQKDIDWLYALAEKMGFHKCKIGEVVTEWKKEGIDDKMLSKPKQEWSEEDEKYLNRVINLWVNDFGEDSDTVKWLKSLRPSWKPSEAQLMALHSVIDDESDTIGNEQLKLLYRDLNKL